MEYNFKSKNRIHHKHKQLFKHKKGIKILIIFLSNTNTKFDKETKIKRSMHEKQANVNFHKFIKYK